MADSQNNKPLNFSETFTVPSMGKDGLPGFMSLGYQVQLSWWGPRGQSVTIGRGKAIINLPEKNPDGSIAVDVYQFTSDGKVIYDREESNNEAFENFLIQKAQEAAQGLEGDEAIAASQKAITDALLAKGQERVDSWAGISLSWPSNLKLLMDSERSIRTEVNYRGRDGNYHKAAATFGKGQLLVNYPSGNWELFQYDSKGRLVIIEGTTENALSEKAKRQGTASATPEYAANAPMPTT